MATINDIHKVVANNLSDISQINVVMNAIKELHRLEMIFLKPVASEQVDPATGTTTESQQTPQVPENIEPEKIEDNIPNAKEVPPALDDAINEAEAINESEDYIPLSQLFQQKLKPEDLDESATAEELPLVFAAMDLKDSQTPLSRKLKDGLLKSHLKTRYKKALKQVREAK